MKKVVLIMTLILVGFTINSGLVLADNHNGMPSNVENRVNSKKNEGSTSEECGGYFGNPDDPKGEDIAYYMQQTFNIIRIVGPILVILLTIMDLIKVTAEQKQDGELKKLGIKTFKRLIYAVVIFVLPSVINTLFHIIGLYGTCGVK